MQHNKKRNSSTYESHTEAHIIKYNSKDFHVPLVSLTSENNNAKDRTYSSCRNPLNSPDGNTTTKTNLLHADTKTQPVTSYIVESGPITGLKNLGSSCYMNCILQCLSHTLPLREFYVSDEYKQYLNNRGDLSSAFKRVMEELWSATSSVVPSDLKREVGIVAPIFSDYRQHDAHELMRFLLNELHEEINRASVAGRKSPADNETLGEACARHLTWEDSRISELFGGMLRSEVCCSVCSHKSIVYIPFMDLSLSLPEIKQRSSYLTRLSRDTTVHLKKCLSFFTTNETLIEEARPYCSKCRDLTISNKQVSIDKLPKFLVIQLKRFSYYPRRTKLSIPVKFCHRWRLKDSSNNIHTYSLYGIVCHLGGLAGGHYIAYCKYRKKWRCFNDPIVRIVSWKHVKHQEAYILLYRDRNTEGSTKHSMRRKHLA